MSLLAYYEQEFPCELLVEWLSNPDHSMTCREWSFLVGQETYKRYQCFASASDLKRQLLMDVPKKIDIGAVYNQSLTTRQADNGAEFHPDSREFVIDIDLTDYDNVRSCCSKTIVCEQCWKLVQVGVRILARILTHHFAFRHVLWIFSGRRGVHAWICDESARKLDDYSRKMIANYLTLDKQTAFSRNLVLHYSLVSARDEIALVFEQIMVVEQGILDTKERYQRIVINTIAPWETLRLPQLQALWSPTLKGVALWAELKTRLNQRPSLSWLYLSCMFPRIDKGVTIARNHLLKAPFCVHPETGRICVPIVDMETFHPIRSAPTLENRSPEQEKMFHTGIAFFRKFIKQLHPPAESTDW